MPRSFCSVRSNSYTEARVFTVLLVTVIPTKPKPMQLSIFKVALRAQKLVDGSLLLVL